jgi:outer membrane protein assembly factor BamB
MTLAAGRLPFIVRAAALLALASGTYLCRPVRAAEDDWPCFRGPDRLGISADKGLPLKWSDSENIVWKTALPGAGASSPITWGDHVYVTCYSGYGQNREDRGRYEDLRRHLVCIARDDGRILWNDAFSNAAADDHYGDFINMHGYASSTPVADATGVYTFFGTSGVRAYAHDGTLRWTQSCGTKYQNFGSGSSPVLFDDLVIINASIEGGALIALEKKTGREAWRVELSGNMRSTPLLLSKGDAHELVFHLKAVHESGNKQGILAAVDPRSGEKLWQCQALDNYLVPSPIAGEDVIYAMGSYPNCTVAIRAGGRGDVTGTHTLWEIKHGAEICTPVLYEGHLYWANNESGIAFCVEAKTGKTVYRERLNPRPGRIYASGVIGDGKLYYVSRETGVYVLPAAPRYEVLAHNKLQSDSSVFNATPAVGRGRIFLRSDRYLYCIGER